MKNFLEKNAVSIVVGTVLLLIVVFGFTKAPSEQEKQAQANAQEIIKLVNTQNTFNNKILENKAIIEKAEKMKAKAISTIDETEKLMEVANDKLKKFNLKYGQ